MNSDGSWTHGVKWAHVQLKLRETKKMFIFGGETRQWVELEREMREIPPSLYYLWRSGGRNPWSQDLKFIYSTRATRGYDNTQFRQRFCVWRRKVSERSSTFSLRFTAIGGSVSVGPRLKAGVLVEGNVWTPKSRIFFKDSSGSSGRPWVLGLRDSKKFRLRSKR